MFCRDVEVVKVQQYGCFVALNAQVQALVHVSELDVGRVPDPASLFQAGDRIDVKVLDKNKRGQLQLSRQENCCQGSLLCGTPMPKLWSNQLQSPIAQSRQCPERNALKCMLLLLQEASSN